MNGALTVLQSIPMSSGFENGIRAYDPVSKRLYELTETSVWTFDAMTGATLAKVSTSSHVFNAAVNTAGELVVFDLTHARTAKLDPTSGAVADLAPAPSGGYYPGLVAFDRSTNRLYQQGDGYWLTVDGATGVVLANVPFADKSFYNAVLNNAGEVIGPRYANGAWHMSKVDPATGTITDLTTTTQDYGFDDGMQVFDPCTNRIYQFQAFKLFTFDGASGALLSVVTMPQQNFLNAVVVY